jgi:hypothetical protein
MTATSQWSESISIAGRYLSGEVHQPFQVVGLPVAPAIPGELVRVNINFSGEEPAALMFKAALIYEIEPFIVGVGKVCCFCTSDGIVVLQQDVWEQKFIAYWHGLRS